MTKDQAEFLKAAYDDAGLDCDVLPAYSGRGMYGRATCAVQIDNPMSLLGVVLVYVQNLTLREIDKIPEFGTLRQDQMGKSDVVIY